ncbi:PgpB Membrane-associated phospholipid phosphatase [Flavobacteriaceae bacterium]
MLEKILSLDQQLFVFLNGLGCEKFDMLWLFITKQSNWTPFFLLLLFFVYKKMGIKQTLFIVLFIAALITFTDQTTNLIKNTVQRLRPCNNEEIKATIRIVKSSETYSFFSGHATNSMAVATFLFLLFKSKLKYLGFLFLWPLIFAYSRIYLGLHYPLDIISGYIFGAFSGFLCYKLFLITQKKYFPN